MGSKQALELLHSKANQQQNEKMTYGMGGTMGNWYDQQGINVQNIQTAHTMQ